MKKNSFDLKNISYCINDIETNIKNENKNESIIKDRDKNKDKDKDIFTFKNVSFILNDIEEDIICNESNNINLNVSFKTPKEFINYLKYIFPELETFTNKNKIIIYLSKHYNNKINNKIESKDTHKKFVLNKINELKYVNQLYFNIKKKKNHLTFIRLFKIINMGYKNYKKELFKTLN